jgi:hypothetical protein
MAIQLEAKDQYSSAAEVLSIIDAEVFLLNANDNKHYDYRNILTE